MTLLKGYSTILSQNLKQQKLPLPMVGHQSCVPEENRYHCSSNTLVYQIHSLHDLVQMF